MSLLAWVSSTLERVLEIREYLADEDALEADRVAADLEDDLLRLESSLEADDE